MTRLLPTRSKRRPQLNKRPGSSISQRSRSWTVRGPPSRVTWRIFLMSHPAIRRKRLEFHRKAFGAQGWKELPNSTISDESASAMFSRDGFVVSLSVIPFEATGVSVRLQNLGNVKPGKLPVPPGAKSVYAGDPTAMYDTDGRRACDRGRHPQSIRRARLGALWQGRGFRLLQTERNPRYGDCLVRTRAGREDHDPVFESANLV